MRVRYPGAGDIAPRALTRTPAWWSSRYASGSHAAAIGFAEPRPSAHWPGTGAHRGRRRGPGTDEPDLGVRGVAASPLATSTASPGGGRSDGVMGKK
jgi:hypothetical protein